ncbi:MAG: phosphoribosylanthranilate isomerase [Bacteroidaceae bacterium]|nr:phosphoribosylanthranilate isomerase [Bacteroidaceae bacterium]
MIIKVCGMRLGQNIREVEALGVDWIGMIFYPPSPRYVAIKPDYMPRKAKRVGVMVDESTPAICRRVADYGLHMVQLHGNESPQQCREIKDAMPQVNIIKALSIKDYDSLDATADYEECGAVDYFLFDTYCKEKGGSGLTFDHSLLQRYQGHTPFLLSGGLSPQNVEDIKALSHPMLIGYDLNSRFETAPAIKDPQLIKQFIAALK